MPVSVAEIQDDTHACSTWKPIRSILASSFAGKLTINRTARFSSSARKAGGSGGMAAVLSGAVERLPMVVRVEVESRGTRSTTVDASALGAAKGNAAT